MAEAVDYFIPPEFGQAGVLAGALSPLPANACDAFVRAYVPEGGLVWDPFCRTDVVARAAARQGKRAFLSDFNPLIAFTVRATLRTVSVRQLDRAFAALAAAPVQRSTLEAHINALYATNCPVCGQPTIARSFTWSGDPPQQSHKDIHCLNCGASGAQPVSEDDVATLSRMDERGRAYWTVMERLGATEGALQPLGERLLAQYTARSLYALTTIQGALDVLPFDQDVCEVLMLGLLDAMERCRTWRGDERSKRRSGQGKPVSEHSAEPSFTESNCWAVFAEACSEQRARLEREANAGAYLRLAPSAPDAPGAATGDDDTPRLSVRQASAARAAGGLAEGSVHLVLTSPPVVDWGEMLQLTYLWTGWLLGKDQARLFSPEYLLHPKRPGDWPWFYAAMQKSLRAIAEALAPAGKMILCLPVAGVTYLNVLVLAAAAAGLRVENIAYQPSSADSLRRAPALGAVPGYCYVRLVREDMAHALSPISADSLDEAGRDEATAAAVKLIAERGEATAYVWLHLASLVRLSQAGVLERLTALPPGDIAAWDRLRRVQTSAAQAAGEKLVFVPRLAPPETTSADDEASEDAPAAAPARQHGWWWLADASGAASPLSDRAEWAVYTVLSTTPLATTQAIARVVYALFPGLQTPDPGLIEACLQSYATPASPVHWQLRPGDALALRTSEQADMLASLVELGHRLGFKVWIGRTELRNRQRGAAIDGLLMVAERYMSLEDILPGAGESAQAVDVAWYQNRRVTHIFQVSWTAMIAERVLRQRSQAAGLQRFVVVPAERSELVAAKIERMPLLRQRIADNGWQFLRFDALRELASLPAPGVEELALRSGLQRQVAPDAQQLALW